MKKSQRTILGLSGHCVRRWHAPGGARWPWLGLAAGGLVGLVPVARGQYALQVDDAYSSYVQGQRNESAGSRLGNYNVKLGPTGWKFGAGLALQYTSNAGMTQNNPTGDFIFQPSGSATMLWPISDQNSLTFNLTAGYLAYVKETDLSRFYINPGSALAFNIFVGDVRITLYNRASMSQSSYQNPTVGAGNAGYSSFQNAIGAMADWKLDKGSLNLGFEHLNYIQTGGNQNLLSYGNSASQVVSAQAGYAVTPEITLGPQVGLTWINYQNAGAGDAFQWNAGVFGKWMLSEKMNLNGSLGYTVYSPNTSTGFSQLNQVLNQSTGSPYFQLAWSHQLNQVINYSVNAGYTITTGQYSSGPTQAYNVGFGVNWNILRGYTLSTPFNWYNGNGLYDFSRSYSWYSAGIILSRPITKKLTASLGYNIYIYSSDQSLGNISANSNYTVNNVTLSGQYSF